MILGCYVLIHGQARAHWTKQEGGGKSSRTVHYEGIETYLNSKTYVFGRHGGEYINVEAGIHRYNFGVQLPDLLPSSMTVKHGEISYFVEAVVDIPFRIDKDVKVGFTVLRNDNYNLYPEPMYTEQSKTFCCVSGIFCQFLITSSLSNLI
jgi:hypothetical protein